MIVLSICLFLLSACDKHKIVATNNKTVILTTLNGATIDLTKLGGKWVIINYWASWCRPCYKEIPELNKVAANYQNKLLVLGISYDQVAIDKLPTVIKKMQIKFPTLKVDPAMELGIENVPGLPVTYLINPQGKLVKELLGVQTEATLLKAINFGY